MQLLAATSIYNDWAARYESDIADKIGWSAPDVTAAALIPLLQPGAKIFEAGIGTGYLAEKFVAARGAQIWGADGSPDMLRICRDKALTAPDRLILLDLETQALPHPDNMFEASFTCGVAEYIDDPALIIREMARVTAIGGPVALCFEADPEGTVKTNHLARNRRGVSNDGDVEFGAFFYYHHPVEGIRGQLAECGVETAAPVFFQSIGKKDEPIVYALVVGRKAGAAPAA